MGVLTTFGIGSIGKNILPQILKLYILSLVHTVIYKAVTAAEDRSSKEGVEGGWKEKWT